MRRYLLVWMGLLVVVLSACNPRAEVSQRPAVLSGTGERKITVLAAASLTESFRELGKSFEAEHPGVRVDFNFGSSQQLAQQLSLEAAADVFASASSKYMDVAIQANRVVPGSERTFAKNKLIIIFPEENPAVVTDLISLTKPGLKVVLAAKEVPAGQYALEFLEKASTAEGLGTDFQEKVTRNIVSYEENVKAVLAKVALGEADAGIVYASDAVGGEDIPVGVLEIPDRLNVIASYPIAPLADSASPDLAQLFVDLVMSPAGQDILRSNGLTPVE